MANPEKIDIVIGGTSGLGLEVAKRLSRERPTVITGRTDPLAEGLEYREFDLRQGRQMPERMGELFSALPEVHTLVYAAGYYQEGRIDELSPEEIEEMLDVSGRGLIYAVRDVLSRQNELAELITITSTSQWVPRQREPVYNFGKAGAGHFSNAVAEDGRVSKVLVVGPAGMRTAFWEGIERDDLGAMLEPEWVADEITKLRSGDFAYNYTRILRDPPRVETLEER